MYVNMPEGWTKSDFDITLYLPSKSRQIRDSAEMMGGESFNWQYKENFILVVKLFWDNSLGVTDNKRF